MPPIILSKTGVKKPAAGQNPYFVDIDETLQLLGQDLSRWKVPAGASEAAIVAALADCHAAGGGVVELMGSAYTVVGNPALQITKPSVSLIGQGSAATVITYTGAGDCIKVIPIPATVVQMGRLAGFTIDGAGAGTAAIGVDHVDSGTMMDFDDVVIRNFDKASAIGCLVQNVVLWNERGSGRRLQLLHNKIGMKLLGVGTFNSFFYHRWTDLRLNVGAGQIGIQLAGTALLQGGQWDILANIDGTGGVIFDLIDTAVMGGVVWLKGEQTSGAGGIARRVGASAVWGASGMTNMTGCVDSGFINSPWEFAPDGRLLRQFASIPTVTMSAGAGTAPPAPVVGTNSNSANGNVIIGTGTSVPAASPNTPLFRVTFATPYPYPPVPRVSGFGVDGHRLQPYISAVTSAYFDVAPDQTPLDSQPNSKYGFFYSVDS